MKLSTKILFSMLAITTGLTILVSWMVSLNVSAHETMRVNNAIGNEIYRSIRRTGRIQREVQQAVRSILESADNQKLLRAAFDPLGPADSPEARQLRSQVLSGTIAKELADLGVPVSFIALAGPGAQPRQVIHVEGSRELTDYFSWRKPVWPVDRVLGSDAPFSQYLWTSAGLYIALGMPVETNSLAGGRVACFVGIDVEKVWSKQLFEAGADNEVELTAWYEVQNQVVARATSRAIASTGVSSQIHPDPNFIGSSVQKVTFAGYQIDQIVFQASDEKYLGQVIDLDLDGRFTGRFVIAASLDQALIPLKRLQQEIIIAALLAVFVSLIACRYLTNLIVHPVEELLAGTRRVSEGNYDHPVKIARQDELGILARSFNQMAEGLRERARLLEERFKRIKLEDDLLVARKIQLGLLPKTLPEIPGFDLAVYSQPAEQTGGDIYDIIRLPAADKPGQVMILLADATGHGIGSALSVTQVRSMFRVGVRFSSDLPRLFSTINPQLCHDLDTGRFVSVFAGILDPQASTLSYLSAGHGPLLIHRAADNQIEMLDPTGIPMGITVDHAHEPVCVVKLEPGDRVILLTDGFHESMDAHDKTYSLDRIMAHAKTLNGLSSKDFIAALIREVDSHTKSRKQADDRTAVVLRRL